MHRKYLILLIADAAAGAGTVKETPEQTIARLTASLSAANEQIASFEVADKVRSEEDKLIGEKIGKGLTRDQAIAVIKRQKEHDKALADRKGARQPRLKEIIAASGKDTAMARKTARAEFPDLDGAEFAEALKGK